MQWIKSLIFIVLNAVVMLLMGILFLPWAAVSARGARTACRSYTRWVRWLARVLIGLDTEIRGPIPTEEVLVAAKHQSFLDIMMIFGECPSAKFIMKRELLWTPIIGLYAYRFGCVPVARGKRGQAIAKMLADVEKGRAEPGQLVIYPQGTRVRPGVSKPYKVGAALLYEETGQACVPAATNCGLFWPKGTILRKPGKAVVEFLPAIQPGLGRAEFLSQLEATVEDASNRLMAEEGFDAQTVKS